ncbi:hypothetical protein GA0115239_101858 [Streptomyces sp. BpilaLS-43]|uniref:hypothetical protein n=1 Tax=Streptomyces sp. BpilaLS-43 TaxID=1839778 RepID=UPI00081B981A|nr:hypothetical protein [Streptomyces sp. BpilaLS-43]SCD44383.1 hypothetical protein GA0115239_101858 [Streptomyces sp. BpilaLS-43]
MGTNGHTVRYVRFQSPHRNERGTFTGVFGLVNTLARTGRLTAGQEAFRRANNRWYDAAYPDPSTVDPAVYDDTVNPGAAAWFKPTATHLIERVPGYLGLLAAHGVACRKVVSTAPGRIVYEDDVQIVVVPFGPEAGEDPVSGRSTSSESGS